MVKGPVYFRRYILRAKTSAQALICLFGRCPCETEELVAIRSGVSTETFLNVCGYRFRSVTKLGGIRQTTIIEQLVDIVYDRSRAVEYP